MYTVIQNKVCLSKFYKKLDTLLNLHGIYLNTLRNLGQVVIPKVRCLLMEMVGSANHIVIGEREGFCELQLDCVQDALHVYVLFNYTMY